MKITFEGHTFGEILDQLKDLLNAIPRPEKSPQGVSEKPKPPASAPPDLFFEDAPVVNVLKDNVPVDNPVEKPAVKPKAEKPKTDKTAALAKARAAKEAKKVAKTAEVETAPTAEVDPADAVRIRQKTIEDLQSAYANGHQQEVFELLSRFGNGAKSFRELPPEAFMPIREAIDKGALT